VITIPMSENSRSLNVAVSAGIVIAESRRQFEK
jgi:tRNA G18 (ribose-2'-O)-methylase SpoU